MDPSLYPSFSAYERNKSIAAAQQQAVSAAQAAHSRAASISSSMSSHPSAQSAHHHPSLIHSHRQLMPVSRSHMNSPYDHLTEESAPKRPRLFPDSKPLPPLHIHTGDMIDMGKKVSHRKTSFMIKVFPLKKTLFLLYDLHVVLQETRDVCSCLFIYL